MAFVLNFYNHCKTFHCKNFLSQLSRTLPQTFNRSNFIKFPILITLLISFSLNQGTIFLYKYSCLCFNKSVFNRTFCQLRYSRKNPIVRKLLLCLQAFSSAWTANRKLLLLDFSWRGLLPDSIQIWKLEVKTFLNWTIQPIFVSLQWCGSDQGTLTEWEVSIQLTSSLRKLVFLQMYIIFSIWKAAALN